ncbi:MAG TPA: hypothetical protein VMW91_07010, partial [Desulfosporosinus sp.]|nr:hypothetical protein [Desulfosporosinus sp.]
NRSIAIDNSQGLGKYIDYVEGSRERLFLAFRGYFKTTLITICHTIQLMLLYPDIRILIASHKKEGGSGEILQAIKRHFIGNERFRGLFPEYCPKPNTVGVIEWGTSERVTLPNRSKGCAWPEATIEIAGSTTDVTGRHYDYIKNDDLVTRDSVANETMIQKTRSFKALQMFLFNQPEWGVTDVIGTPYHFNDLYAKLRKSRQITKLVLPAIDDKGEPTFPDRFTKAGLKKIKNDPSMGSYEFSCTPAETPILMADFSFKKISDVRVGDEVIGFTLQKGKGNRRKLVKTKVKSAMSKMGMVNEFQMSSGRAVRATEDHKWYTGREDESHKAYREAKVGSKLMFVIDPKERALNDEEKEYSSWLGGMFDGEGSCPKRCSAFTISQSLTHNPEVCKSLEFRLSYLGYTFGRSERSNSYYINGGFEEKVRFIKECKPVKSHKIIENIFHKAARFVKEEDEVKEINPVGFEPVYALETETGNYIAWGYASSNSQYLMNPVPPEDQTFRPEWLEREGFWYDERPESLRIYILVDPASKRRKASDFTAITVFGLDRTGTYYLLRAVRDKLAVEDRTNLAIQTAKDFKVHKIYYETIGFQDTDAFIIDRKAREQNYYIEVVKLKAQKKSKEDRIKGLQPLYERGNMRWPKEYWYFSKYEGRKLEMIEIFRDEMMMFPKAEHDDLLDSHSQLLQIVPISPTTYTPEVEDDQFEFMRKLAMRARETPKHAMGTFRAGKKPRFTPGSPTWQ